MAPTMRDKKVKGTAIQPHKEATPRKHLPKHMHSSSGSQSPPWAKGEEPMSEQSVSQHPSWPAATPAGRLASARRRASMNTTPADVRAARARAAVERRPRGQGGRTAATNDGPGLTRAAASVSRSSPACHRATAAATSAHAAGAATSIGRDATGPGRAGEASRSEWAADSRAAVSAVSTAAAVPSACHSSTDASLRYLNARMSQDSTNRAAQSHSGRGRAAASDGRRQTPGDVPLRGVHHRRCTIPSGLVLRQLSTAAASAEASSSRSAEV